MHWQIHTLDIMPMDRSYMEIRYKVWFNSYDIVFFFLKNFIFIFIYVYLRVLWIYATCV